MVHSEVRVKCNDNKAAPCFILFDREMEHTNISFQVFKAVSVQTVVFRVVTLFVVL
jgi:hypothetical protein